jgi:putative ABC transport system permease protein
MTDRGRVPGERLYAALLYLYPRRFRERYGFAMAEFYRDRRREAGAGRIAAAAFWTRQLFDTLRSAAGERLRDPRNDDAPEHQSTKHSDPMLTTFLQDLRYAVRGMLARPGFTAIVVATLALGIGANAAIFSVVNAVLIRPLPFREPERILYFSQEDPYYSLSEPEFRDYKAGVGAFERLAAFGGGDGTLMANDQPTKISAARVSDGFFTILGVAPLKGRTFAPDEDLPNAAPVVIISHALWVTAMGADENAVGKSLILNDKPRLVVGIMPADFDYPDAKVSMWLPLRLHPDSLWTRNNHYLQMIGKLRVGATREVAFTQASTLGKQWAADYPETYFKGKPAVPILTPIRERYVAASRPFLVALLGAVGFVLLVACVNVANLLLARGESRRRELAIRTALGASRRRLIAQALTESGLFALAGGALGFTLAAVSQRALLAMAPAQIPRLDGVQLDGSVLLFTFAVSLATGMIFGLLPALRAAGNDPAHTLKDGGQTSSHHGATRFARRALVVSEVALAVVMLTGSGLMLRSLWTLQSEDMGFDAPGALTARISLPPQAYTAEKKVQFFSELEAKLRAVPGVTRVASMGWAPVISGGGGWSIMVDGRILKNISESPTSQPQQATADFFGAMGIAIVSGRGFEERDREGAPYVTVVNEAMAKALWPGQDAVGHTIKMWDSTAPWATVVGVSRDMRSSGAGEKVPPTMFFPYAQAQKSAYYTPSTMTVLVRGTGDPMALASAVRRAVRELDKTVPVSEVQTLSQVVGTSFAGRRFSTMLLVGFAVLALLLTGIGIYGVISYGVSQRTYEIGLRMAMGAGTGSVMRLIVSEGVRLALIGLAIGLAGGVAVSIVARSMLVGVSVLDVPTLAVVSVMLVLVAALASFVPARRAIAVSPTSALRGG